TPDRPEVAFAAVEGPRIDVARQTFCAENICEPHRITHCMHLLYRLGGAMLPTATCDAVVQLLRFIHPRVVAVRICRTLHRLRIPAGALRGAVVVELLQLGEEHLRRLVWVHSLSDCPPPGGALLEQ